MCVFNLNNTYYLCAYIVYPFDLSRSPNTFISCLRLGPLCGIRFSLFLGMAMLRLVQHQCPDFRERENKKGRGGAGLTAPSGLALGISIHRDWNV